MPTPEMYRHLVTSADIAVGVLLNADGSDAEFLPIQPRPFPASTICALEAQWASRRLRFIGVMAWIDGSVQTQLEALPDAVASRLDRAFETYLTAFSTDSKVN